MRRSSWRLADGGIPEVSDWRKLVSSSDHPERSWLTISYERRMRECSPRVTVRAGTCVSTSARAPGGHARCTRARAAGGRAAGKALGGHQSLDLSVLPRGTFTEPAVATVGLTEEAARAAGIEPLVSKLPLEHVPRALAARDTRGFVKLIADAETRRIVGAHILAAEAGEMIMEPALAMRFGLTIEDLTSTLHPYLPLAEGIKLAALTFDKDVATLSCCAV